MWVIVKDKLFNLTRVRIIEKVDKHKDRIDHYQIMFDDDFIEFETKQNRDDTFDAIQELINKQAFSNTLRGVL